MFKVKDGWGPSKFSTQNVLFSGAVTPEPKTTTHMLGTRDVPVPPDTPPIKEKYRIAVQNPSLSDNVPKAAPVDDMLNQRDSYLNFVNDKAYFPGLTKEADKKLVRDGLLGIQERVDQNRLATIRKEQETQLAALAKQKANEALKGWPISELTPKEVMDRVTAEHTPVLAGAELVTLTIAVAAAAAPADTSAEHIARALQILKDLDLEGAIKGMGAEAPTRAQRLQGVKSQPGAQYSEADENLAWRIAYRLASANSAEGFKILKALQSARKASGPDSRLPATEIGAPAANTVLPGNAVVHADSPVDTPPIGAQKDRHAVANPVSSEITPALDQAPEIIASPENSRAPSSATPPANPAQQKEVAERSDVLVRTFLRAGQIIVDRLDQQNMKIPARPGKALVYGKIQSVDNSTTPVSLQLTPGALFREISNAVDNELSFSRSDPLSTPVQKAEVAKKDLLSGLAGKAILGVHQNFDVIRRKGMLPAEPVKFNWACNAVRNGFTGLKDPRFVFAARWLGKVKPWIERASMRSTFLIKVMRYLMPFKNKTPFAALDATADSDRNNCKLAEESGLAHDRAIVAVEKKIAQAIKTSLEKHRVYPNNGPDDVRYKLNNLSDSSTGSPAGAVLRPTETLLSENQAIIDSVVRYEMMTKWGGKFLDAVSAVKLTAAETRVLHDAVLAKFEHADNNNIHFPISANVASSVSRNLSRPVTPALLEEFAERIDIPEADHAKLLDELKERMHLVKTAEVDHTRINMKSHKLEKTKALLETLLAEERQEHGKICEKITDLSASATKLGQAIENYEKRALGSDGETGIHVPQSSSQAAEPQVPRVIADLARGRAGLEREIGLLTALALGKDKQIRQLENDIRNIEDPKRYAAHATRSLLRGLRKFFKNAELGSRMELSSGGAVGFDTGLALAVAQAISKFTPFPQFLMPILGLNGKGGRSVHFTAEVDTTGPAIRLGAQPRVDAGVSVGIRASLGFDGEVSSNGNHLGILGANVNAGVSVDQTGAKGIELRVPRLTTGVVNEEVGKKQITETVETLLTEEIPPEDEGLSPVQRILQHHDNTSIGVVGKSHETGYSGAASAGFNLGLALGSDAFPGRIALGVSGSAAFVKRLFSRTHVVTTGFLQSTTSVTKGSRTTATVGGSLNIGRGPDLFIDAPGTDGMDVLGAGGALANGEVDVYKSGSFIRSTLTALDGDVSPRSFRFITYENAADFKKAVKANIREWAHERAKRLSADEYNAGGARRQTAVEEQVLIIQAFLKDATERANPNQQFSKYLELAPLAVKKINEIKGVADLMLAAGKKKDAMPLEEGIMEIREDARSWKKTFLVITERALDERSKGLHSALTLARTMGLRLSKIHIFK